MNAIQTRGVRAATALAALLAGLAMPAASHAQTPRTARPTPTTTVRTLSLDEAIRLAESQSEALTIARAGVLRARGQHLQARSQQLPQLSATGSYARTLKSQFEAFAAPSEP